MGSEEEVVLRRLFKTGGLEEAMRVDEERGGRTYEGACGVEWGVGTVGGFLSHML